MKKFLIIVPVFLVSMSCNMEIPQETISKANFSEETSIESMVSHLYTTNPGALAGAGIAAIPTVGMGAAAGAIIGGISGGLAGAAGACDGHEDEDEGGYYVDAPNNDSAYAGLNY